MANLSLQKIVTQLRRASVLPGGVDLTDGQLLAQFIGQQDEAAFAALVQRHGSMVLGVCRRLLGNVHDADDAFQATFLILVHKAASLKSCELLGNWLYGVAYNTALAARAKRCRLRSKEKQVLGMPEPAMTQPNDWSDLRPLLDQELSQLADHYREAIVLCDLEGKSRKEAARQLGIPESTLSGRLTTARRKLAKRLARHGITLSVGAVAAVLSQCAVSACVPMPLVASTVKAAATVAAGSATAGVVSASVVALTQGVLKTMFLTKVKTVSAVVLAFLLATGVVLVSLTAQAGDTKEKRAQIEEATRAQDADEVAKLRKENEQLKKEIELLKKQVELLKKEAKAQPDGAGDPKIAKELEILKGTWNIDSQQWGDKSLPKELMKGYKFVFDGNKLTWEGAIGMMSRMGKVTATDGAYPCEITIDPAKEPKQIDILMKNEKGERTFLGIYEIKGDTLKVCYFHLKNGRRPTEFSTNDDSRIAYIVLSRAKK